MKLAIPVGEKSMDSKVFDSFGRAPYFIFYDMATNESVFLENRAIGSRSGAGVRAAQTVVDGKADVLLTPQCGQNAAALIETANIKIYVTKPGSVQNNIDAFIAGELSLLGEIH